MSEDPGPGGQEDQGRVGKSRLREPRREAVRELVNRSRSFVPATVLIARLNRQLRGWANYFSFGHPRKAMRAMNWFVRDRLKGHLRRRSQRPFRPPKGRSYYVHLRQLGLVYL